MVVENKQWSRVGLVDIEHRLVTVPGVPGQERLHPQAQVRRYAEHLRDFNRYLGQARRPPAGCVYLHNATSAGIAGLRHPELADLASFPAFALVVLGLSGTKVSWRRLAALGAGAVAAVLGLGLLDLRRPAGQRTHLGRLFEQIGHDGLRPFTDAVQRKIQENLSVLPTSIWIPLVPSVLAFLAWLAYGSSPRLEAIRHRAPEMRPAFVGLLVAAVLGMALNDSGIAVPAMMLGVLNPVVVRLALRTDERDLSPAPLR